MENITHIVKNTLIKLKSSKLDITPDNYFKEFYVQARKEGLEIKECEIFDRILKETSLKNVHTYSSLAQKLFEKTKHDEADKHQKNTIDNEENLKLFARELKEIMAPSIQFDIEEEIELLTGRLEKDPSKLLEKETIEKLKSTSGKRVKKDREVLFNKTNDIVKLTKFLSKQFEKTIISSSDTSKAFSHIKNELETLDISKSSIRELGALQSKLVDTVCNLEEAVEEHRISLLKERKNFNSLEEKFLTMQQELVNAQEEKKLDYLTNIYNRRAFDIELEKIEKKHDIFHSKYAIVFYDIDHFKKINDSYGHDCGDIILKKFSNVLKKLTRGEDTVARYGGEEFVVLLNYDEEKEIVKYAKRVKELIKNSDFNYQDKEIKVTFSAGIAYRDTHTSAVDTLNKADSLLYDAKKGGRDKIMIEDGTVI